MIIERSEFEKAIHRLEPLDPREILNFIRLLGCRESEFCGLIGISKRRLTSWLHGGEVHNTQRRALILALRYVMESHGIETAEASRQRNAAARGKAPASPCPICAGPRDSTPNGLWCPACKKKEFTPEFLAEEERALKAHREAHREAGAKAEPPTKAEPPDELFK